MRIGREPKDNSSSRFSKGTIAFLFLLTVMTVLWIMDKSLTFSLSQSLKSFGLPIGGKNQNATPSNAFRPTTDVLDPHTDHQNARDTKLDHFSHGQEPDIWVQTNVRPDGSLKVIETIEVERPPSDYHCEISKKVCKRELKAHPEWQKEVLEAIHHSWDGYGKGEAFGEDAVDVVTGKVGKPWIHVGVFMIDSLSTLWLAGLRDEFDRCVAKIRELDWDHADDRKDSFFELAIRLLGGLIGAYDLSGERVLLEKAKQLGDRLLKSFGGGSPFPYPQIDLVSGEHGWDWNGVGHYGLAAIGSFQMEFIQLSHHTGDPKYKNVADKATEALMHEGHALIAADQIVSGGHGQENSNRLTVGGAADSYFEYLLKMYIQSGKKDAKYLHQFEKVYDEAVQKLQIRTQNSTRGEYMIYWDDVTNDRHKYNWQHLACFISGTLALGHYRDGASHPKWQHTSTEIARTCHEMYVRSPTGLASENVRMNDKTTDFSSQMTVLPEVGLMRPEAVESWYYLHYFTGDPKYREWAHEYLVAMNKHARAPYGYSKIEDVTAVPATQTGFCESFVMAETLKYLYLIMSDRSALDLSKYVLNTEAHPFRIHN